MRSLLLEDARRRPDLFIWTGPIPEQKLRTWLRDNELLDRLPDDLIRLWRAVGGGDYFETESILSPLGDVTMGDDVLGVRALMRGQGLEPGFLPFARGAFTAAIDTTTGEYVELGPDFQRPGQRYRTLDDWYLNEPRREFAQRYGLA